MTRVAVLQFPGINSEYETLRALWDAGIEAELFRWNQDPNGLDAYDGFLIPGGFSYEDRGRSGLIASMDPIMQEIRKQADSGKPVLGICNGAQILVESGLIPGGSNHELLISLARNKRIKDGVILGVGFYNENVTVRCDAPGRSAFTLDYKGAEIESVPVAHGEGRFTSSLPELLPLLQANAQITFRYCNSSGEIDANFPSNPNGAMDNAAAICNPRGNVMAIMPHPERSTFAPMPKIFTSMRKYMEERKANPAFQLSGSKPALELKEQNLPLEQAIHKPGTIELFVQLKITDNEAQTIENALRHNGFDLRIRKWTHYAIEHKPCDQKSLAQKLISSGELLNPNKEKVELVLDGQAFEKQNGCTYVLIQDKEDTVGASKTIRLKHILGDEIMTIHHGIFWEISGTTSFEKVLATKIFANPHAQDMWKL